MSKKYKDGSKYLISMIQHIARIQEYLQSTSEGDYLKQGQQYDGINKQVDLLGEQVSKLIDTKADNLFSNFRDAVPWVEIRALRNRIAHESVLGRCEIARPRREKRQQLSVREPRREFCRFSRVILHLIPGQGFVIGHQWSNIVISINGRIIPLAPIAFLSKNECKRRGLP